MKHESEIMNYTILTRRKAIYSSTLTDSTSFQQFLEELATEFTLGKGRLGLL